MQKSQFLIQKKSKVSIFQQQIAQSQFSCQKPQNRAYQGKNCKISISTSKIANSQFSRHKAQNLNFHAKNRKILIFTPISLPPETSTSTLALLKWHVSSSPSYL